MKLSGFVSPATLHCPLLLACVVGWMTGGCTNPEDALSRPKAGPPEPARVEAPQGQPTEKITEDAGDGGIADIVIIPLKTYKKVRTNLNEIQITHQMKVFEAKSGRKPKDFAEYKKEILDPIRITLPELPDDDRYVFDPEVGELQVRTRGQ